MVLKDHEDLAKLELYHGPRAKYRSSLEGVTLIGLLLESTKPGDHDSSPQKNNIAQLLAKPLSQACCTCDLKDRHVCPAGIGDNV